MKLLCVAVHHCPARIIVQGVPSPPLATEALASRRYIKILAVGSCGCGSDRRFWLSRGAMPVGWQTAPESAGQSPDPSRTCRRLVEVQHRVLAPADISGQAMHDGSSVGGEHDPRGRFRFRGGISQAVEEGGQEIPVIAAAPRQSSPLAGRRSSRRTEARQDAYS